jgi:hypothetical protein
MENSMVFSDASANSTVRISLFFPVILRTFVTHLLIHMDQKKKHSENNKCKQALNRLVS